MWVAPILFGGIFLFQLVMNQGKVEWGGLDSFVQQYPMAAIAIESVVLGAIMTIIGMVVGRII